VNTLNRKQNVKGFLRATKEKIPEIEILEQEEDRLIYAHAVCPIEYKWMLQGPYPHLPEAILLPRSTHDVSEILKLAHEFSVGLIPYGGGSGSVGGTIPDNGQIMIDVKRLRSFDCNTVNHTATGGAGLTGAEFEDMLNEQGFTTGHYPQSYQSAVLGGMAATSAIGTFSTKYGKMDDMVNSLEVVLPDGSIVQTHKAPKRSTGLELKSLFIGTEGVYGIITKVEMKIYPIPETRYLEAFTFPTTLQGLEAVRKFIQLGVTPPVIRLYDHEESKPKIAKFGFEKGYSFLVVGYEGLKDIVEIEKSVVHRICSEHGGSPKGPEAGFGWLATRLSTKKIQDHHALRGGTSDAMEVAAPWDSIGTVWQEMRNALEPISTEVEAHFSHVYHTGASVYVIFHVDTGGDDHEGEAKYMQCVRAAIEASVRNGGNVSHHHGIGTLKVDYLAAEHGDAGLKLMKDIKNVLDPQGLLNKGVLGL
jgi:alkyldihydroxyacetonephosphate synthase